jgi:hypothetical protein
MDKRERFIVLAERRVPRALRELRLIGNLANRHNYSYTQQDAKKIISTLESELRTVKSRFVAGDTARAFKL